MEDPTQSAINLLDLLCEDNSLWDKIRFAHEDHRWLGTAMTQITLALGSESVEYVSTQLDSEVASNALVVLFTGSRLIVWTKAGDEMKARIFARRSIRSVDLAGGKSAFAESTTGPAWPGRLFVEIELENTDRLTLPASGTAHMSRFGALAAILPSLYDDVIR